MIVIGVDPHKSSHTAAALDHATHGTLGTIRAEATLGDYRRLLAWARRWSERRWTVENARGLGRHLAQWLIARGETVVDVPPTATARIRELSRGGRPKNDVLDAAAAAAVAALRGETAPVVAEDASTVLSMLDERRGNLTRQRTRTVNQLHALLRELLRMPCRHSRSGRRLRPALRVLRGTTGNNDSIRSDRSSGTSHGGDSPSSRPNMIYIGHARRHHGDHFVRTSQRPRLLAVACAVPVEQRKTRPDQRPGTGRVIGRGRPCRVYAHCIGAGVIGLDGSWCDHRHGTYKR
ncbi:IS110 family transposase [Saccharothrix luteola]|uniref:IS110 family transposase n=1 Tax=Saccharothrix luteola TaxID=2893018 RepID=UPI001E2CBEB4|nr:IS110 family transposase [Saccharothrix luteola]MCC8243086.1 IS110 family transposase [Saccharothrix luteola]